jgi:hypothetical protein
MSRYIHINVELTEEGKKKYGNIPEVSLLKYQIKRGVLIHCSDGCIASQIDIFAHNNNEILAFISNTASKMMEVRAEPFIPGNMKYFNLVIRTDVVNKRKPIKGIIINAIYNYLLEIKKGVVVNG